MKIITINQPWASLIALGVKKIETRSHRRFANLVGERIGIHASRKFDGAAVGYFQLNRRDIFDLLSDKNLPHGVILCTAAVESIKLCSMEDDHDACCAAAGLFGLFLRDVVEIEAPIEVPGHQGIWNYDLPE